MPASNPAFIPRHHLAESRGVRFKLGFIVCRFEGSHNVEAVTLDYYSGLQSSVSARV